jgi:hypothetical protein
MATMVLIDNTESFNAWLQRVEFGTSLRLSVTLSGLALESTSNSGGTDFSMSLYDETGADLFGGPAVLLAISPDIAPSASLRLTEPM